MEDENQMRSQRLIVFLEAPFYKPCTIHENKNCIYFCFNCMGSTFCEFCRHSEQYKGHQAIRVFRSSRETAVRRKDIRLWIDISDIQKYTINKKAIAYLKQRRPQGYECKQVASAKYCAMCRWKLDADFFKEAYIYCSIECKFRSMERMGQFQAGAHETSTENQNSQLMGQPDEVGVNEGIEEPTSSPNQNNQLMEQTEEGVDAIIHAPTSNATRNSQFLHSKRQKRRKGRPQRSPFF